VPANFVDNCDDDPVQHVNVPPNAAAFNQTLEAFVRCISKTTSDDICSTNESSATNTKTTATATHIPSTTVFPKPKEIVDDNYDNYFKKCGIYFQKRTTNCNTMNNNGDEQVGTNGKVETCNDDDSVDNGLTEPDNNNRINNNYIEQTLTLQKKRKAPKTLDLTHNDKYTGNRKRRYLSQRYSNLKLYDSLVEEECEYDSDVGFFKCKPTLEVQLSSSTSSTENIKNDAVGLINDLNSPQPRHGNENELTQSTNELNIMGNDDTINRKIVSKRIEFFESSSFAVGKATVLGERPQSLEPATQEQQANGTKILNVEALVENGVDEKINEKLFSTTLCLGTFVLAFILLIFFPLPN
jgi:hypothetical protein